MREAGWSLTPTLTRAPRPGSVALNGVEIPLGPHITPEILRNIREGTYERPEARLIEARLDVRGTW